MYNVMHKYQILACGSLFKGKYVLLQLFLYDPETTFVLNLFTNICVSIFKFHEIYVM